MILQLNFSEFIPDQELLSQSPAVIINYAVDFVMTQIFPEFNEWDIIDPDCSLICDKVSQRVYIEIRPVWLANTLH